MAKPFSDLRSEMDPRKQAEATLKTREAIAEMLLAQIRKLAGLTRADLAEALGIRQPSVSKLEAQSDMQISTLRGMIEALGGSLEIVAHFPDRDIRLSQFRAEPAGAPD